MSLQLDWVSNIQIIPKIDSPLQDSVLCAPEVQFSPWLSVPKINLANCTEESKKLPKGTILLEIKFKQDQLVGISSNIDQIISKEFLHRNVLNFSFLKNITKIVSRLASTNYIQDITSYSAHVAKKAKKEKKRDQSSRGPPQDAKKSPVT